jgi:hypothetical protein
VDPILTGASSASKILPLAYNEQRKLRRRDEVRNLFNALPGALQSDHRIPAAHKKKVLGVTRGLRVDPTICGGLKALLDGNSSALPAQSCMPEGTSRTGSSSRPRRCYDRWPRGHWR